MKIHIVQKGDTLWELAKKYGVDFEQLKELNSHLSSPDMIMPGMKIKIPGVEKAVQKELPEVGVKHPFEDFTAPAQPITKEKMAVEEEMPEMPQMPAMPQMPEMPQPQMPMEQMQLPPIQPVQQMQPIMEQQMKHYTINLPQLPGEYKNDKKHKKKVSEKMVEQPMPAYGQMPAIQPVYPAMPFMPVCCIVHHCPSCHVSAQPYSHHPCMSGMNMNTEMEMPMPPMYQPNMDPYHCPPYRQTNVNNFQEQQALPSSPEQPLYPPMAIHEAMYPSFPSPPNYTSYQDDDSNDE